MERPVKRRLATCLADRLRVEIRSGAFGERLPGLRLLAASFGVSVPTVGEALHQLATEGVVEAGGERRGWRVKGEPLRAGLPDQNQETRIEGSRLLFLSSEALGDERFSGIECYAELVDQLKPGHWEVIHRVIPFDRARKPHASWDQLLRVMRPAAVIVWVGIPAVAEWLGRQGMRGLFIGGDSGRTGIPVLASSTPAMFGAAIRRLIEAGHRKIMVPLCGRQERFAVRCVEAMRDAVATTASKPDVLVVVESSYSGPDVVVNLLRKHWPLHSPDALVVIDWREFVAADSLLRANGLAIPRDVSVVILSHDSSMNWHLPPLSHFDLPVRAIARIAARWVRSGQLPAPPRQGPILIAPRWVEAGSVALRKPGWQHGAGDSGIPIGDGRRQAPLRGRS